MVYLVMAFIAVFALGFALELCFKIKQCNYVARKEIDQIRAFRESGK